MTYSTINFTYDFGTNGNDAILGSAGNDRLYGKRGNDTLNGGDGNDFLYGNQGNDFLNGGGGNDSLSGGDGRDALNGGDGSNTLTGGAGADVFIFSTALGPNNIDTITDFKESEKNTIHLNNAIFNSLPIGAFSIENFVNGTVAKDSNSFIIYDSNTGNLYYDADGNGTASTPVQIATLTGHPTLKAADFVVTWA